MYYENKILILSSKIMNYFKRISISDNLKIYIFKFSLTKTKYKLTIISLCKKTIVNKII